MRTLLGILAILVLLCGAGCGENDSDTLEKETDEIMKKIEELGKESEK